MTCGDARERFSDAIDERLSPTERADFTAHLSTCADCRREFERLTGTVSLLHAVIPARAPAGFVDRVMSATRPAPWYRRVAERVFVPLPVKLPVQAAAIVLVAVGVVYVFRSTPELQRGARVESDRITTYEVTPPAPRAAEAPELAKSKTAPSAPSVSAPARNQATALSAPDRSTETPSAPTQPSLERPRSEAPRAESPRPESPRAESPRAESPRAESPRTESPRAESPRAEPPRPESPRAESPRAEPPRALAPSEPPPAAPAPAAEPTGKLAVAPPAKRDDRGALRDGPRDERRFEERAAPRSDPGPSEAKDAQRSVVGQTKKQELQSTARQATPSESYLPALRQAPASGFSAPEVGAARALPVDVAGRLQVADVTAARRALLDLVRKHGGAPIGQQAEGDAVVVSIIMPRARYATFSGELAPIGQWIIDREGTDLPDAVHLRVRLTPRS